MSKYLLAACILLSLLTIVFARLFQTRLAMPFNANGNYFDESSATVYQQQSVAVYGLITLLLVVFTVFLISVAVKRFRHPSTHQP